MSHTSDQESRAPLSGLLSTRRRAGLASAAAGLVLIATGMLLPSAAGATQYQRPFEEVFGPSEQPSFTWPRAITADRATGDVLVADAVTASDLVVKRYHADGTPAPFADLGTNAIDGKGSGHGPGAGGSCVPVSLECDETPQNGLVTGNLGSVRMAIDESGGPTDGDIYVAQNVSFQGSASNRHLVYVFSEAGRYLGQIKSGSAGQFLNVLGVAVDPSGTLYVAATINAGTSTEIESVSKYVASVNPPVASDSTATFALDESGLPAGEHYGSVSGFGAGAGSSAGSLFLAIQARSSGGKDALIKMNAENGENHRFAEGYSGRIAVDPTTGNPIVRNVAGEAFEFDGSAEAVPAPLSRTVVESEFGKIEDIAVDASGDLYAAMSPPAEGNPLQVRLYGEPLVAPTVVAEEAIELGATGATLTGTVNPEGVEVSECLFEWGTATSYGGTAPCESLPPTDSEPHEVRAKISGLLPNGATYHYRLAAKNTNGTGFERSADEVLHTAHLVKTEPAEAIGAHSATLNGVVRPEASQYTECVFEYGLTTSPIFEHALPCEPEAALIPADSSPHAVKADLSGLQEATAYRFRLKATNGAAGTRTGEEETFETFGPPKIEAIRASGATQASATLEAEINPSGFPTSYRFEWGPTPAYGNALPASLELIGEGTSAVRAIAPIAGLSTATTYHYRVIAQSSEGREAKSADQTVETLNSCGLLEARCFELVSPRVPFAAEQPGRFLGAAELKYQAAEQPGALAYVNEVGREDATRGAEVLYLGTRGPGQSGWSSSQLSPPITAPDRQSGGTGLPSLFYGFSKDLSCSILGATQPLTEGTAGKAIIEAGGGNLYRRDSAGAYTLLTATPPETLKRTALNLAGEFELIGMTGDCSKIVFSTKYHYSGVSGSKVGGLYEWDEEHGLRYVGFVPTEGGGEEAVAATGGSGQGALGAVSEDGARVVFSATRLAGKVSGEAGKKGVFVREGGTTSTDISASETLKADIGAEYQGATPDGHRVYFTANAGIAANGESPGGTDLYEYDFGKEPGHRLTDLSATEAEGGARVGGPPLGALVGFANDGSHVYFVARGQLDLGRGSTLAKNEGANTYSLYDHQSASGANRFVAMIGGSPNELGPVTVGGQEESTSRVSEDGRYLLFESRRQVTAYDSHGMPEAYLYDAQAGPGAQPTICLSCRQDGTAPVDSGNSSLLTSGGAANRRYQPQSLVIRDGRPLVFFRSKDDLAPGATEGIPNLYEWSHGQVTHLATEAAATASSIGEGKLIFTGASADGTDLYFFGDTALNWENPEGRPQAWDARIGGGFAEPAAPSAPCDPASEGACRKAAAPPPVVPSGGAAAFTGQGNVKPKPNKRKKAHKRKHRHHHKRKDRHRGKKHKANKKGHQAKKHKRNRRAGK